VSNLFYGVWLAWEEGGRHWQSQLVRFQEVPITATIQLSTFSITEAPRFEASRNQYAMAYIETIHTPLGPTAPTRTS
jgi:hypothetical protein